MFFLHIPGTVEQIKVEKRSKTAPLATPSAGGTQNLNSKHDQMNVKIDQREKNKTKPINLSV